MYKLQAVASDLPSLPARTVKVSDRQRIPLRTVSVLSTGSPPENYSVWC